MKIKRIILTLDAFNMKTTTHPTVGQEVQCNSETSQSCYYKWKHSDIVVSTSRAIIPRTTGHYQCEAECNIRGKRCIVFGYVYISDEGMQWQIFFDNTLTSAFCFSLTTFCVMSLKWNRLVQGVHTNYGGCMWVAA